MTKNGSRKFGGSENRNRTRDKKRERIDNDVNHSRVEKEPRERVDKPRAPKRPDVDPYNGKRASNISTAEYNQLRRIVDASTANYDLRDVIQWYKINYSAERRANVNVLKQFNDRLTYKNFRGEAPVLSDDIIYDRMRDAREAKFFSQCGIFDVVNRAKVLAIRSIPKRIVRLTKRFGVVEFEDEEEEYRQVYGQARWGGGQKLSRKQRKALNGSHGEATESDDVDAEVFCTFPRVKQLPHCVSVEHVDLYRREFPLSVRGVRYLVTSYCANDGFCASFSAVPIEACSSCTKGYCANMAHQEEAMFNLDDAFYEYICCPCECPAVCFFEPEQILDRRGYYDNIVTSMVDRSNSLNHVTSSLNGSHGEATESDDVKKAGGMKKGASLLSKIASIEARLAASLSMARSKKRKPSRKGGGGRKGGGAGGGKSTKSGTVDRKSSVNTVSNFGALAKLHPHTQKYMIALANPHSENATGVGDVTRAHNSRKADGRISFVVSPTATEGVFIFVCPAVGNDDPVLMVATTPTASTGTYNGTTVAGTGTRARYAFGDLPYAASSIGNDTIGSSGHVQGKVVCIGIKVTAIGAALNRGGEAFWYESDNHTGIVQSGADSFASVYNNVTTRRTTRRVDLARDSSHEFTVTQHTSAEHEFSYHINPNTFPNSARYPYSTTAVSFSSAGSAVDGCPVAVLVFSETASVHYRIEAKIHCEYIGNATKSSATMTHSDPEVGRMVADSVIKAKQTHHLTPHKSIVGDIFKGVMTELGAKALQGGTDMLKKEMANPELLSTAASMVGTLLF